IVDVTNGARLETYVIAGPRGSGVIGINGAAARLVHPGDLVILIAYGMMSDADAREYVPRVVLADSENRVVGTGRDPAPPRPPRSARMTALRSTCRTRSRRASGSATSTPYASCAPKDRPGCAS